MRPLATARATSAAGRGGGCGTGAGDAPAAHAARPNSYAPRSGAGPVNQSVYGGSAVPALIAGESERSRKSPPARSTKRKSTGAWLVECRLWLRTDPAPNAAAPARRLLRNVVPGMLREPLDATASRLPSSVLL